MDHKLKDKTVCIAGLGYVGLPLARSGNSPGKVTTRASRSQTIRKT